MNRGNAVCCAVVLAVSACILSVNAAEPALETPQATLDAAIKCTGFSHPDRPPVLLVHGTGFSSTAQWNWNYLPLLAERGFDVCGVTYPDRGLGDTQVSAEYVVNALRRIHAWTGRKVAMIGHSQGATMPRWALKWWPSARGAVADFVAIAPLNHGSTALPGGWLPIKPAVIWQFNPGSKFIAALNRDDETPGTLSYTMLYATTDELVQPALPAENATSALDRGVDNPRVRNINLQAVCPLWITDHILNGTSDPLAFALALDAITHPGPANFERAGGKALCRQLPLEPSVILPGGVASALAAILGEEGKAIPNFYLTNKEPPLKRYAR